MAFLPPPRQTFNSHFNDPPPPLISLYFANFPANWDHTAFRSLFSKYVNVYSIYVSPRVNRAGQNFGFLRVLREQDSPDPLAALSPIWIGSFKLRVDYAKFQHLPPRIPPKSQPHPSLPGHKAPLVLRGRRSFAEASFSILGPLPSYHRKQEHRSPHPQNCHNHQNPPDPLLNASDLRPLFGQNKHPHSQPSSPFKPNPQNLEWLSRCAVGIVLSLDSIPILFEALATESEYEANIIPMGGNMVLLEFRSAAIMAEFLADEALIIEWSKLVKPWDASFVSNSRLVWLKCFGTPAHVWCEEFFSSMVSRFGKFIHLDSATSSRSRLDLARVLISSSNPNFISQTLRYSIDGKPFNIQIVEDPSLDYLEMMINLYKKRAVHISSPSPRISSGSLEVSSPLPLTHDTSEDPPGLTPACHKKSGRPLSSPPPSPPLARSPFDSVSLSDDVDPKVVGGSLYSSQNLNLNSFSPVLNLNSNSNFIDASGSIIPASVCVPSSPSPSLPVNPACPSSIHPQSPVHLYPKPSSPSIFQPQAQAHCVSSFSSSPRLCDLFSDKEISKLFRFARLKKRASKKNPASSKLCFLHPNLSFPKQKKSKPSSPSANLPYPISPPRNHSPISSSPFFASEETIRHVNNRILKESSPSLVSVIHTDNFSQEILEEARRTWEVGVMMGLSKECDKESIMALFKDQIAEEFKARSKANA